MAKRLLSQRFLASVGLAVLLGATGCGTATQEPSTSGTAATPSSTPGGTPARPAPLASFAQEITSSVHTITIKTGSTYALPITVKNTGSVPWVGNPGGPGTVDVGYRWVDGTGKVLPIEGNRAALTRPSLAPGETDSVQLPVASPPEPGSYTLWVSMVQEGVDWFFLKGSKPLAVPAKVS